MNTDSMFSQFYSGASVGSNRNLIILAVILVIALYINLAKVYLGSRYFLLTIDFAVFAFAIALVIPRLFAGTPFTRSEYLVGLLLLIGLIQVFNPNVPNLITGIEGFRKILFQMIALFIGVSCFRSREDIFSLTRVVVIASIPILLYAIKQFFYLSDFDYAMIESNTAAIDTWMIFGKVRSFGLFSGPFHLGIFSGFIFWASLALHKEYGRKLYLYIAILAGLACLSSLTRSSILALAVSLPLVLIYVMKRQRIRVLWITTAIVLFSTLSVILLRSQFEEIDALVESVSSVDTMLEGGRFSSRLSDYQKGFEMIAEHPLGLGVGSAADAMEGPFVTHSKIHVTSHNLFMRIVLEMSVIGLIFLIWLLYRIWSAVKVLNQQHDQAAAYLVLGPWLIIMIAGLTGSTLGAFPVLLVIWALTGMAIALSRTYVRENHAG